MSTQTLDYVVLKHKIIDAINLKHYNGVITEIEFLNQFFKSKLDNVVSDFRAESVNNLNQTGIQPPYIWYKIGVENRILWVLIFFLIIYYPNILFMCL